MRPLTELETETFFSKLATYIGKNIIRLLEREDGVYVFRLHRDRVFYVKESMLKKALSIKNENLLMAGNCFGKFTKTKKFKLHITSLIFLSQFAQFKVWIKQNGEMPFLYGNNIVKAHINKISDDTPKHQGIIIYSIDDTPLGFGVTARSSIESQKADPSSIVIFHQADVGEYLRDEDTLI